MIKLNKIIESGIIVSLFLGLAYFFTYQYQKGLITYYNLPEKYIDLSLENVVEIFAYILIFSLSIYSIIRTVSINVPKLKYYKAKEMLFISLLYAALVILAVILLKAPSKSVVPYTICFAFYIIYCLLAPLIMFRKEKNYSKKWALYLLKVEKSHSKEEEFRKTTIFHPYERSIAIIGSLVAVIILVGGFFETSGKEQAQYSEEYYIAKNYSDKVVVFHTKEFYVLMEHNEGVLKNEFQIVSADEIGTLKKEKIGVLKFEN